MQRRLALVRRPSPRLSEGIVTHIDRVPVDYEAAVQQWEGYCAALRDADWQVIEVPPADDAPDGVFIEDVAFVYGDLAVLCRSGAPERRSERQGVVEPLTAAGYRVVEITDPGTLDGGDVLKHGGTVWVGRGGRTNAEGAAQLASYLEPMGVPVVTVPLRDVLHLKSAVTALPDGTVVGLRRYLADDTTWPTLLDVPEDEGSHVLLLGGQTVLMSASAPQTAAMLRDRGLDVVAIPMSEFEKLEGCVTCLSIRLRG